MLTETTQIQLAPTASTITLWMPLPSTTPTPRNLTAYNRELCPLRPSQQRQFPTCDFGENPFPFVWAVRGVCTSGNQTLQSHGSSCCTDRYKRPVPAKGKHLGGRVPTGTGKFPNFIPLTLAILLTDLTRSQRSLGLMTLTRAGFMTRDPRGKDVV